MTIAKLGLNGKAKLPTQGQPASRARNSRDCVTILVTNPGKIATKQFVKTASGVEKRDYDAGHLFGVLAPWIVHNVVELSALLTALEELPNCLVIRGKPKNLDYVGTAVRRTGSGGDGNFETPPGGRYWILIDFDKIEVPPHLSLHLDAIAVCEYLILRLPPEFHDASYHWTLSSSAGMGTSSGVSMHIWFWLTRPIPDAALKVWAKALNRDSGQKLVDGALFQHVQAHYTAAPIFDGVANPFPTRSGLVEKAQPAVKLIIAKAVSSEVKRGYFNAKPCGKRTHSGSGFEYRLSLIGDHAGGEGFHGPIIAAVASFVSEHGEGGTNVDDLYEIMKTAVKAADASSHDAAYVAYMASREHIVPALESAIRKFGAKPRVRRKTKLHAGVQPHFDSQPVSIADAQRQLAEIAALGL